MKKKNQKSIEENLLEFERIIGNCDWVLADFDKIYLNDIKPTADSPYMFNYFHWITNFKKMCIEHKSGVKKMLGYEEETFSLEKCFSIIHPNFRPFVLEYSKNTYEMLKTPKYKTLSNKAHFSIQFPILRADGEYILVQMNVSIIMVDNIGSPLINYNRFEVLGKYFDTPIFIKPRINFRTGIDLSEKAKEAEAELSGKVRHFLLNHLGFTDKELEVLKCLGNDLRLTDISDKLNIPSVETIKKHNLNIIKKARIHLSPLFANARDIAKYLKGMGII